MSRQDELDLGLVVQFEFLEPRILLSHSTLEATAARDSVSYGGQTVYIDFVKYPLETYDAKTWSDWGKGIVASNGKVYTAIGDHNAPSCNTPWDVAGNAFIYEYDPETKIIRCVADLQEGVSDFNASTDWGFGKVHGRINEGRDGNLYFASYWGDDPEGNPDYEGEYIFEYNPYTEQIVDVNHVDGQPTVAKRSMPSTNLWAEGMIFYAETTHGDTNNRDFLVYDLEASAASATIYLGDHDHTHNRAMMVDANGDAWFNIGGNQLQQYDISARAFGTVATGMPGSDLRQVTAPDSNGYIYATAKDTGNLFRFDPATGNFKNILTLEGDVAAMELDPTGDYIYYLPVAHGPYGNSPLIQVDISDIDNPVKTTIVELENHLDTEYGYDAGGSYSLMVSQDGRVVYIEMNIDFNVSPYEPSFIAVHIPSAKATFMDDPESISDPTEIAFTDVASSTGLETIVGEQYGHSAAWGDYNDDGLPDLFFGAFLDGPNRVVINNGDGTFSNDPQAVINIEDGRTSGSVFADFDNDGDLDLMISNNSKSQHIETNRLYRNEGAGTFTNVTTGSGIGFSIPFTGRNIMPLDYDADGLLDVFMQEDWFGGTNSSHLMRNTGNMVFTDVTTSAGLPTDIVGIGGAAGDFNNDGYPDILSIASPQFGYDNLLYINDADGTFSKATSASNTFNSNWASLSGDNWCAGAALGDLDNDGDMDVVIGQHYEAALNGWNRIQPRVYRNDGNDAGGYPVYTDITGSVGLEGVYCKQPHVEIADFDNDGYMDIATASTIEVSGNHTPVIYRNKLGDTGTLSFELPSGMDPTVHEGYDAEYGPINPHYFPGSPTVDYNLDGALDYFGVEAWPTGANHSPLFENTGATEDFLDVMVNFATRSDYTPALYGNAQGIGSTVEIYEVGHSGDLNYLLGSAVLQTGNGFSSGSEPMVHFGIPAYTDYSSGSNPRAIGGWAQTQRFVDVRLITPGGTIYSNTVETNQRVILPDMGTVYGPQANFSIDTSDATSGTLLVHFDAGASYDPQGAIMSYDWNFDDGNTDTGETVNHTYSSYGTYDVTLTIENDTGVTDSKIITFVLNTPAIVTHPQNASVQEETSAVFTVEATGTALSYQWEENTGGGWNNISGATGYTYVIPIASVGMDQNQYRVHISNQFNTTGIDSNAATLTVTTGPNFVPYARYYYDTSDVAPGNIEVHFNAEDSYDLDGTIQSYSWDFGDTNSDTGMEVTHTYSGNGDAYSVTLTVTDDKNVTDQQVLTVDVEVPHITNQPSNDTIEEWQKGTFSMEGSGTDLQYQWQVNEGSGWEDIPNANQGSYQTPYMMTSDSGNQYRCIVSNQYNTSGVTSNTVTLTVNANATPTIDTHPVNASAGTGWKAEFWVVADGYGEIDYQWQYNTGAGWNDVTHATGTVISTEGSVTIPFWSADDAANGTQYRCTVSNNAGSATSNAATLTVTTPTTVTEDWYVDGAGGSASVWPSDWSFEYDPSYVNSIDIQAEHGQVTGSDSGEVIAYVNDENGENVDMSSRFSIKANIVKFGMMARRGDSDPDTFYYAEVGTGTGLTIYKRRDGADYDLLSTSQTVSNGQDGYIYDIRLIVITNPDNTVDLSVAVWETSSSDNWTTDGDPDAATWYYVKDEGLLGGNAITASGRFGYRDWVGPSGRWVKTDDLSVKIADGAPNLTPEVHVKADPEITERTVQVSFDAKGAADPDGDLVSYKWDFDGDDSIDQTTGTYTTTHTYGTAGTYTVKLTVEDDDGATADGTVDVILYDPNTNETTIDNTSATLTGTWTTATTANRYYGSNYIHDNNTGKGSKQAKYTPNISGSHDVYIRYYADEDNADNVPVKVVHSGGTANLTVDMSDTGLYMNERGLAWEKLGTYTFATGTSHYVEIDNTGTTGYVIADAVRFVPTPTTAQVTLATSGTAQMNIYVPSSPSAATTAAANRLESVLEDITGGNFTQTTWSGSGNGIKIGTVYEWAKYLDGVDEAVDLYCPEGVYVASEGSDMIILGKEEEGVMDAVYTFLKQDDVGARFYGFWEDWWVIPSKATLTANFKVVTEPWAWMRLLTTGPGHYQQYNSGASMDSMEFTQWEEYNRLQGWMEGNVSHNYSGIVPDIYFAEHPEWFSWNAELQEWRKSQINTRHPVVQEMGIQYGITRADATGNILISISPNDGSGFDQSPYDPNTPGFYGSGDHTPSDNVLEYTNIVAKGVLDGRPDLADRYYGFYIYASAAPPPTEPHDAQPNTLGAITTAFLGGQRVYNQIDNWGPYLGALGIRDYHAVQEWSHVSPDYREGHITELQTSLPYYENNNVVFYNSEGDKGLAAHVFQYYYTAEMLWKDHDTLDNIRDNFYTDLFEDAADYVESYQYRWDSVVPLNWTTLNLSYQDIDDAWDAETNTPVRDRLDDLRCYLHALKLRMEFNDARDDGEVDDDLRPEAEALAKFWGWFARNEGMLSNRELATFETNALAAISDLTVEEFQGWTAFHTDPDIPTSTINTFWDADLADMPSNPVSPTKLDWSQDLVKLADYKSGIIPGSPDVSDLRSNTRHRLMFLGKKGDSLDVVIENDKDQDGTYTYKVELLTDRLDRAHEATLGGYSTIVVESTVSTVGDSQEHIRVLSLPADGLYNLDIDGSQCHIISSSHSVSEMLTMDLHQKRVNSLKNPYLWVYVPTGTEGFIVYNKYHRDANSITVKDSNGNTMATISNSNTLEVAVPSGRDDEVWRIEMGGTGGLQVYGIPQLGAADPNDLLAPIECFTSAAPSAPSSLSATAASTVQIDLSWTDNAGNESGFKIERAPDSGGSPGTWAQIYLNDANDTTYSDTGLTPGTKYHYRVRATNPNGDSSWSNTDDATTQAGDVPTAPTSLSATAASSSQINLSWTDNANNEDGFKVERAPDDSGSPGEWAQIDTVSENQTSYNDTSLPYNTKYHYRVRAYNEVGNSSYTNVDYATTDNVIPAAPTSLTATKASSSQIDLAWTDNSDNETGFKIERAPDSSGSPGSFSQIDTVGAGVTIYNDTGLDYGTTYWYRVRATNAVGDSSYTNNDSATTDSVAPSAPSSLVAADQSSSQIDLSWTDNADNEDGFKIERSPDGSTGWTQIATKPANSASHSDTGLSASTTYYYRVCAYNTVGDSSWSNTANDTTQSAGAGERSETWTGDDTDPWPGQWTFEGDTSEMNHNDIQSNEGRVQGNIDYFGGIVLAYINDYNAEDVDQTVEFDISSNAMGVGLVARRQDSDSDTYYFSRIRRAINNDYTLRICKMVDGVETTLYDTETNIDDSTERMMRFLVETDGSSTNLKLKMWTGSEPGTWDADISDSEAKLQDKSGRFGLYYWLFRARAVTTDDYSATDLAAAAVPNDPSSLSATKQSSSQINLSWTDNSADEDGFKVERSLTGTSGWTEIGEVGVNTAAYNDTGLNYNTTYYYRVRAFNEEGYSGYSNTDSDTTDNVAPAAPTALTATPEATDQIQLDWTDNADNETGFKIERAPDSSGSPGSYSQIDTVGANVTTYEDTSLSTYTKYWYRVRATNAVDDSSYSNEISATTFDVAPSAPSSLEATVISSTEIDLDWTDNSSNETLFIVQRSTDGSTWADHDTTPANQNWYHDSGLTHNTTYWYRVRAHNDYGNSSPSNEVSETTQDIGPVAPSDLSATVISSSQIDLAWTDNSDNEDNFIVQRSDDGVSNWGTVGTVAANTIVLSDTGLNANTTYYYRVFARNLAGDSMSSNVASATTENVLPAAPSSLVATAASSSAIDLTWTDNSDNEDAFLIERADDVSGSPGTWGQIDSLAPDSTSYSDTGLSHSTKYHYRVAATNELGDVYSNITDATTTAPTASVSETWTGSDTDPWPSQWSIDNNASGVRYIDIYSNRARIEGYLSTPEPGGGYLVQYLNTMTAEDTEATLRFSIKANGFGFGTVARRSDTDSDTYYYTEVKTNGTLVIKKKVDGTVYDLLDTEVNIDDGYNDDKIYDMKFRVETSGSNVVLKVKCWETSDTFDWGEDGSEPGTWHEVTDDGTTGGAPIIVSGRVGLYYALYTNRWTYVDDYTVTDLNAAAPDAPSALTATAQSSSQIDLSWTDNSDNETGFKIERAPDDGGVPGTFTLLATKGAGVTTHSDTGLSSETTYYYRVYSYSGNGNSAYTNIDSDTTQGTIPTAPSSLSATKVSSSAIDVTWTDNSGNEDGFKIERALDDGGNPGDWAQIDTAFANETTYHDTGLPYNTKFHYRVRAYNVVGDSSYSNTDDATTDNVVPTDPTNLFATTVSTSAIDLDWTDNSDNETGFKIERAPDDSGSAGTFAQIDTVNANVTSYSDTGLSNDTTYWYRVRANNAVGDSGYTDETSATTFIAAPSAPSSLGATAVSSSQIDLTWTDNSDNEASFEIERSPNGSTGWTLIYTVGEDVTSYSDTGLAAVTQYYYRVRAINAGGNSSYSNTDDATTQDVAPVAPSDLVATAVSSSAIDLGWTDNSNNETGFKIDRAPDDSGAPGTFSQIDTVGANVTTYNDTGLSASTKYYYRVRAYNGQGDSGYSNNSSAVTEVGSTGMWDETWTGSDGAAWPAQWTVESEQTLHTNEINNNEGYWIANPATTAVGYIDTDSAEDVDITIEYTMTKGGAGCGLMARGTASSSDIDTFYYVQDRVGHSSYSVRIFKMEAGVSTQLFDTNINHATGVWYKMRFYVETDGSSTQLKVKTWERGTDEPTAWDGEITDDTSGIHDTSGRFGVWGNLGVARREVRFDNFHAVNLASGTVPAAPTSLGATKQSSSRIDLSWTDNSNNENLFVIQRAPDVSGSPGAWGQIDTVVANSTSYSDTGLNYNTTYHYRVLGRNDYGDSTWSNVDDATTDNVIPAAPTSLTATGVSTSRIDLSWTDNADNETGFKIERAPDSGGSPGSFSQIDTVGANVTTYNNTSGLTDGTKYHYRVRATNEIGDSSYSNTDDAVTTLAAPTALSATAQSSSQIDLSWTDNSSSETGFKIERAPDSGGSPGSWAQIDTVGASVTTYNDTGLSASTKYHYRVRAYNTDAGNSAYSNIDYATTQSSGVTENWTGDDTDPWPNQWSFDDNTTGLLYKDILDNHSRVQGRYSDPAGDGELIASINDTNAEDVEQVVKFSVKVNGMSFGVVARRADADSDTFYFTDVETTNTLRIMKRVDGTDYELLDTEYDIGNGSDGYIYFLKFRVENNGDDVDLKVRIWETDATGDWSQNGSEPETWTGEVTDNGTTGGDPITVSGRFGLYYELNTNRWTYTDDYSATILGGGSAMIPGDLNADGIVNIGDLGILAGAYGQVGDVLGDLNKDGSVNVGDLGILAANYGSSAQGGGVMAVSAFGYTAPTDTASPIDALGSVSGLGSASIIPEGGPVVGSAPMMVADVLSPLETPRTTTEFKTVITDAEPEDVVDVLSITNLGPFSII